MWHSIDSDLVTFICYSIIPYSVKAIIGCKRRPGEGGGSEREGETDREKERGRERTRMGYK